MRVCVVQVVQVFLSSTGDVLVRGVGGVCDMCMCLARVERGVSG